MKRSMFWKLIVISVLLAIMTTPAGAGTRLTSDFGPGDSHSVSGYAHPRRGAQEPRPTRSVSRAQSVALWAAMAAGNDTVRDMEESP